MRRTLLTALTAFVVLALPGVASAHPTAPLAPTLPTDVTFAATDNIEYLGRFPERTGTAGGQRLGDRYYMTDPRGVHVYDVGGEKAAAPELLGSLTRFQTTQGVALAQEDPDTDGNILVVDSSANPVNGAALTVVDVSDPANMSVLGTAPVTDHTWECVSGVDDAGEVVGCAYAFGRSGHVVDLTDPTAPVNLAVTWRLQIGLGDRSNSPYTHDLTEVRPGLVMSSGSASVLMDTSALLDAQATDVLAGGQPFVREITRMDQRTRFSSYGFHSIEWNTGADGRLDDFIVAGTEIAPSGTTNAAGSDCDGPDSVIETYDATSVLAALDAIDAGVPFSEAVAGAEFTLIDSFDAAGRGAYVDGKAPAHVLYCAHWMEMSPEFDNGGMLAVSYYDRGTRFVPIGADGTFGDESGWIVPFQGYSGSVQWVTDEVLFIHDYTRGMEVIRYDGEATGTYERTDSPQALTSSFSPAAPVHPEAFTPVAMLLLAGAVLLLEVRRRRAVA